MEDIKCRRMRGPTARSGEEGTPREVSSQLGNRTKDPEGLAEEDGRHEVATGRLVRQRKERSFLARLTHSTSCEGGLKIPLGQDTNKETRHIQEAS
jgi:hypothetical protein